MFAGNATMVSVSQVAGTICAQLQGTLDDAANFASWLEAQSGTDLADLGFSSEDIGFLQSAFADLMALAAIVHGGLPPGSYPQPTGGYDYTANVKQIIGPAVSR